MPCIEIVKETHWHAELRVIVNRYLWSLFDHMCCCCESKGKHVVSSNMTEIKQKSTDSSRGRSEEQREGADAKEEPEPEVMETEVALNDKHLDGMDEFETCEAHTQCSDISECFEPVDIPPSTKEEDQPGGFTEDEQERTNLLERDYVEEVQVSAATVHTFVVLQGLIYGPFAPILLCAMPLACFFQLRAKAWTWRHIICDVDHHGRRRHLTIGQHVAQTLMVQTPEYTLAFWCFLSFVVIYPWALYDLQFSLASIVVFGVGIVSCAVAVVVKFKISNAALHKIRYKPSPSNLPSKLEVAIEPTVTIGAEPALGVTSIPPA